MLRNHPSRFLFLLAALAVLIGGCSALQSMVATGPAEKLGVEVLKRIPHDTGAYTQGLLIQDGLMYESTGLNGRSSLRLVDPYSGAVQRMIDVPPAFFAEGLALVGDKLIQITWQSGVAFVYDRDTFKQVGEFTYKGEGWGLCYDGQDLYMSDGSDILTRRDPETFAARGQIPVRLDGQPVVRLNELECVGGTIYANVWMTDQIVRIDKYTGRVTGDINASTLLTPEEKALAGQQGVLNGIAYDPQRDLFIITGKLWPWKFEVQFVARKEGIDPTALPH